MYVNLIVTANDAWLRFKDDMEHILINTVTRTHPTAIAEDLFDICWHQATNCLSYLDASIPPMDLIQGEHASALLNDLMYNDLYEYLIESEYIVAPDEVAPWTVADLDTIVSRTIDLARELISYTTQALRSSKTAPSFFSPEPISNRTMVSTAVPYPLVQRHKDYLIRCELMIPIHP